jgi:hypothetical protein
VSDDAFADFFGDADEPLPEQIDVLLDGSCSHGRYE